MKLPVTMLILLCTLAIFADDRRILLTDLPQDQPEPGRVALKDVQLLKHYEALKHFARGRMLEQSERIPEALQAYHLANQFDGQAVDLLRHIIPLCFKMEQTASALQLIRRSLTIDPRQPDLWMRYAQELLDLQRYQEALAAVEEAHQKNDYSAYPAFAADLAIVKASCLEALNRHNDAIAAYRHALLIVQDRNRYLEDAFSPTAEELPAEEAKLLERLARVMVKTRQFDEAITHYKQAHTLRPLDKDRLDLNMAEVHLAASQYDKALPLLQKVTASHPPSDEAYRLLLTVLKQCGRGSEVVAVMQKLHFDAPQHTAINLVLAEVLTEAEQYGQAEVLYSEILTVDQAPFKEAILGYFRLLIAQGKSTDVLNELDQIMTQPARARWSRAAMMAILSDGVMLRKLMELPRISNVQPVTRLMLIKLALQLEFWNEAETLTRMHLLSDLKPQETYLLLARALLEQYKFAELVKVCQAAIDHPAIQQPFIFYIELAKAYARLKQSQPALATLTAARELCAPGTTDEHKLLCTELYILHLLKQHQTCVAKGKELLNTSMVQSPWARQVRYVLAHAYEATAQFTAALEQYEAILKNDPNDSEAMAAHARCLLFQNADLAQAEKVIRAAIELDLIEQHKKRRFSPIALKLEPKADYQATLATILLRTGKTDAGIQIMKELADRKLKAEPWVLLAMGDAHLVQHQNEAARTTWRQALELLPQAGIMGTDLTNSLTARLQAVEGKIMPAGATTPSPRQP
ncbi:MAG: tetratricopeptide repeat protein [Gemmatales bacterium]